MNPSLRDLLHRVEPEADFSVTPRMSNPVKTHVATGLSGPRAFIMKSLFPSPMADFIRSISPSWSIPRRIRSMHSLSPRTRTTKGLGRNLSVATNCLIAVVGMPFWMASMVINSIPALISLSPTGCVLPVDARMGRSSGLEEFPIGRLNLIHYLPKSNLILQT
jgi:hypothetical protein